MKDKILHSGIFKLDDDGRPVGIVKLTPEKNLSSETTRGKVEFDPYGETILECLIEGLEKGIRRYKKGTPDFFDQQVVQPFVDSLKEWGVTPEDLQLDLERAKKLLWENLLVRDHKGRVKRDEKAALEKASFGKTAKTNRLTMQALSVFEEYTHYPKGDICRYLALVFEACDISVSFQAIAKRHQRLKRPSK